MTEPLFFRCPRCGTAKYGPGLCDYCLAGNTSTPRQHALAGTYAELRQNCCDLEELIESIDGERGEFSDEDLKRLDKAVTVMKVGFKVVKKVLRRHGLQTKAKQRELVTP